MSLRFCSLASGSSGNSTYISDGTTSLLIDCGLTGKAIKERLTQIGASPRELDGILITHEHSDHTKGAGILARGGCIPIYATEGCWNEMRNKLGSIPVLCENYIDSSFSVGTLSVDVLHYRYHDTVDPVCYSISSGSDRVTVMTDIGYVTKAAADFVRGSRLLVLEANHDPEMVRHCSYPERTKNRILSRNGHLSNADCAGALLTMLEDESLRHVLLGHLSHENNTPELAWNTVSSALTEAGIRIATPNSDYAGKARLTLDMTWQERVSTCYRFD